MKSVVLILISVFCLGMQVPEVFIIKYGTGTKNLTIGNTNLETAVRVLGKEFISVPSIVVPKDNPASGNQFEFQVVYRKKGISLFFYSYSDTVHNISVLERIMFFVPAHAKTTDNIILGVSKHEDIVQVLGEPDSRNQETSCVSSNTSQDTILQGGFQASSFTDRLICKNGDTIPIYYESRGANGKVERYMKIILDKSMKTIGTRTYMHGKLENFSTSSYWSDGSQKETKVYKADSTLDYKNVYYRKSTPGRL